MNFLRQKFKRDTTATTVPHDTGDVGSMVDTMLLSEKAADKSKRRSYFMIRTSSSPLLRRRDAPGPPPAAELVGTASVTAVVPLADSSAPHIQRRRSIPGVAYLIASKRSVASKGAADATSTATGLTAPERAVVHSSGLHVPAKDMAPVRRVNDCSSSSSSTAISGSSSGGDDSSSDSSSGGDSDDTLMPADALGLVAEAEAAPGSNNLPGEVTLTSGDGSGSSSVRSYYSCSAAQSEEAPAQMPREPEALITESPVTSGGEAAEQTQPRPQRRQLRLGRWRTASIGVPHHHSGIDSGINSLAALALRPARLSLGAGPNQQQIRQLYGSKAASESGDNDQVASTGPKKAHRLLSSLGHTHVNLGLSPGQGNSSSEWQRPHVAHRKLSGALGKLLLTPPPPSAAEQAKMDAWAADDDEFSADDYDLSGTYFELMPAAKRATADMSGSGRRKHSGAECTTPESRLSSTSTVVDEGVAMLEPEQYKRIFVSSARKLQLQCGRRGMSCVVHIKTMMTKASEHYLIVSGGRNLDAYRISRQVLADLYLGNTREDGDRETESLATSQQQPATAYPARRRSAGSSCPAHQRARQARAREECEPRPAVAVAVASGDSSPASVVEVPLSSPPPLSPSAEIADAALARIATAAEEAELAEFGMGDLVSLGPMTAMSGSSSDAETHSKRASYRRYRRRRASRWGVLDGGGAGSQSGVVGAIAAL
ncbi:hypothetical protein IWW37_002922 [Coemansia sp. RSA 2050]|nr:hypothetical protein IWW37_002922 [Coemansia sp. RSA 2050]KAJ2731845.1 hypothetical protein IW152_004236 [Coemansia sp. BCRC 34962]